MPLDYNQPNLESSPEEHDAEAIEAGSTEEDIAKVLKSLTAFQAPEGPILDIGCGTGRHLRELAKRTDRTVVGVDLDQRMVESAQSAGVPEWPALGRCDLP